jgi:hypothetical protein
MGIFKWFSYWKSSTEKEKALIRSRYEDYVKNHGHLFEDRITVIDPAEVEDIARTKRKYQRNLAILYAVLITGFGIAVYFGGLPKGADWIRLLILLVAPMIFGMMLIKKIERVLQYQEVRLVKGVITEKFMVEKKGCFIDLSLQLKLQIMPDDYKLISLGDIVTIQILSDDIYVRRKVTKTGNI